jgi:hypothetical protein
MTPCGAEKFSGSGRWRSHRNPQINISQHISQNNSNHDISKSDMFELNLLKVNIYIFIFIHIYIYILCNIMYIYIEREREKKHHINAASKTEWILILDRWPKKMGHAVFPQRNLP